jgi:hypothetical protein
MVAIDIGNAYKNVDGKIKPPRRPRKPQAKRGRRNSKDATEVEDDTNDGLYYGENDADKPFHGVSCCVNVAMVMLLLDSGAQPALRREFNSLYVAPPRTRPSPPPQPRPALCSFTIVLFLGRSIRMDFFLSGPVFWRCCRCAVSRARVLHVH